MTQEVVFMRGLSGSGKSWIAHEDYVADGFVRCNMDAIRLCLARPYSPSDEKLALEIQDQIVLRALRAGHNVVVDNTHILPKWPKRLATLIWEEGLPVSYSIHDTTDVPVELCIERNAARGADKLPDHVIPKQAKEWAKQVQRGPWTTESITEGLPEIVPYTGDVALPQALIVDCDGTLARAVGRSPYEFDRCDEDLVWDHVDDIVSSWHLDKSRHGLPHSVIVLTGRDAKYRGITEEWLGENGIYYDEIHTRAAGDQRRDSVVKLEIFDQHIRDRFDVVAAVDDRLRICKMWHALGIPVLRCGNPTSDF